MKAFAALLSATLAATARRLQATTCPCQTIDTVLTGLSGSTFPTFTLAGETITYPTGAVPASESKIQNPDLVHLPTDAPADCRCTDYGLSTCAAHDTGKKPYCMRSNPPSWCADSWCYVDKNNCDKPFSNSVFYPGLTYSYFTCGASNTCLLYTSPSPRDSR